VPPVGVATWRAMRSRAPGRTSREIGATALRIEHQAAAPVFQRALAMLERRAGRWHPETATLYHHLGARSLPPATGCAARGSRVPAWPPRARCPERRNGNRASTSARRSARRAAAGPYRCASDPEACAGSSGADRALARGSPAPAVRMVILGGQGIAFVVPINTARYVVSSLLRRPTAS